MLYVCPFVNLSAYFINTVFDFGCFSYINTVEWESLRMLIQNTIQIISSKLLHAGLLAMSLHYILMWEEQHACWKTSLCEAVSETHMVV